MSRAHQAARAVATLAPLAALAVCTAFALRFADVNVGLGESGQAARSLLELGYVGNPYSVPTGPTAHVSPLHSAFLAAVFGWLGEYGRTARIALSLACAALYCVNCLLVVRICRTMGLHPVATASAAVLASLLPMYQYDAVVTMRQWDQPFAAALLTGGLWLALRAEAPGVDYRFELRQALLAGMATLVSPAAALAIAAMGGAVAWRRQRGRRRFVAAVLMALVMAAFVVPWGVRNKLALGEFVWSRSNFGLELAVGNRDVATGFSMDHPSHPFTSQDAARRLAAQGEVAFLRQVGQEAKDWIALHPQAFAALSLKRAWLVLFPSGRDVWFPAVGASAVVAAFAAFGLLKLVAILAALLWAGSMRLVWLAAVGLPVLPYVITHVNLRYTYVTFFASACLIAWAGQEAVSRLGRSGAARGKPAAARA